VKAKEFLEKNLTFFVPTAFIGLWLLLNVPKFPSPLLATIDPWIYLGLYLHYDFLVPIFGGQYYPTRLPAIIPGFFAYHVFDTYAAAIFIRVFKLAVTLYPLYWVLIRTTKDHLISIFCLSVLFFTPTFLITIATDYVSGFGVAYTSLATAFLTAACLSPKQWRLWLILAGVSQALMIGTYLFLVSFLIPQLGYLVLLNRSHKQIPLKQVFIFLAIGYVICFAGMGLFSSAFNGRFLFWLPQLKAAINLAKDVSFLGGKGSPWASSITQWLPKATWIILPVTAFVLSLNAFKKQFFSLKQSFESKTLSIKFLLTLQFALIFLGYWGLEVLGFNFLEWDFLACYLFPLAILALGCILADREKAPHIPLLLITFSIGATLLYFKHPIFFFYSFLTFIGTFSAFHFLNYKRLATVVFVLFQMFLYQEAEKCEDPNGTPHFLKFASSQPNKRHDGYLQIIEISKIIRNVIPGNGRPLVWYSLDGKNENDLSWLFLALAETFCGGYMEDGPNSAFSKTFPAISDLMLAETVRDNNTVILLSSDPDAISKADQALKEKGYRRKDLYQNHFDLEGQKFLMLAFLLERLDKK